MDIVHAVLNALLIGAIYYGFDRMGWLDGKSVTQRFVVLLPAIFVATLFLNLLFPIAS